MLVKQVCDGIIVEARVRHNAVKRLSEYYIDNIPGYGRLDVEALHVLTEDGIVQDFIMFVDEIGDESPTTTAHNPIGNTDSIVSIPQRQ